MGARQFKNMRRAMRKQATSIIREFVAMTKNEPFLSRLKIAWSIVRGK